MRTYQEITGKPIAVGQTVTTDHVANTYLITVMSLGGVGPNDIKDAIEKKFKVLGVQEIENVIAVKA